MRLAFSLLLALALPSVAVGAPADALRAALGPRAVVRWGEVRPASVSRLDLPLPLPSPAAGALRFLRDREEALGLLGIELRVAETTRGLRQTVVRLQQTYGGLDVYHKGATVALDAAGARVRSVRLFVADVGLPVGAPDVGLDAAVAAARREAPPGTVSSAAPRVARRILAGPPSLLVYQVAWPTVLPVPGGAASVFVAAASGEVVWVRQEALR